MRERSFQEQMRDIYGKKPSAPTTPNMPTPAQIQDYLNSVGGVPQHSVKDQQSVFRRYEPEYQPTKDDKAAKDQGEEE